MVQITFVHRDGTSTTVEAQEGLSVMEVAVRHGVDIEAACEGSCACATCHMVVQDPQRYAALPGKSDDEDDMLDLAFGLTPTSRLTCQLTVGAELEGIVFELPEDV